MLIGYARISTNDQNLDMQRDALKKAGCEKVFIEQMSGSLDSRPELGRTMEILCKGDTLVVWRLDRLGRSLKHLIELMAELEERGIRFRSLTESIDTATASGKLAFHVFGALAEFERNIIQERTRAGLAAARARGRKGGRPPALSDQQREEAIRLYRGREHSVKEICQMMGISKPTLYSCVKKSRKSE